MSADPIACKATDKATAAAHVMIDVSASLCILAVVCSWQPAWAARRVCRLEQPARWECALGRAGSTCEGAQGERGAATRHANVPLLLQHKFHRVPVVDDAGKCVGIVTRTDIFWALASDNDRSVGLQPAGAPAAPAACCTAPQRDTCAL